MRPSHLWAAAAVALGVTVAGCSGGSTVPTAGSQPTTTAAPAGGSGSSGATPLAEAVAYSQCIRSHGVPNFPDPVQTPSGGYGYRTPGIDPNSAAFQGALAGLQGPAVAMELHRPAALLRPTAGVVELGPVHPRPRGAGLPRPDVLGHRSARLRRRVELAAAAVGDGRLQVAEAVRRWPWRMTGNGRPESSSSSPPPSDAEERRLLRRPGVGPVTRKTWVLAGAAVLAAGIATGGVVVLSGGKHATSAAQEPPPNTVKVEKRELSAMVSLSGTLTYRAATGRFAVLGDQPGQRDIHRVARARPGDLSGPGALPGERQPGGVAVWLDACLSEPIGRGDRRGRGRAQRGSRRARLRHVGSAQPNVRLLRVGHHHCLGEASGRTWG